MAYKLPIASTLLTLARKTVGATYSATIYDELLAITTSASFTITLPNAANLSDGRTFVVVDETGSLSPNTVTINTAGGNINGSSSITLTTNYGKLRFFVRSSNYWTW